MTRTTDDDVTRDGHEVPTDDAADDRDVLRIAGWGAGTTADIDVARDVQQEQHERHEQAMPTSPPPEWHGAPVVDDG